MINVLETKILTLENQIFDKKLTFFLQVKKVRQLLWSSTDLLSVAYNGSTMLMRWQAVWVRLRQVQFWSFETFQSNECINLNVLNLWFLSVFFFNNEEEGVERVLKVRTINWLVMGESGRDTTETLEQIMAQANGGFWGSVRRPIRGAFQSV